MNKKRKVTGLVCVLFLIGLTACSSGGGGGGGGDNPDPVNIPPRITVLSEAGGYFTDYYTIRWTDYDPDNNASISLYYDTDNSGQDGILITGGISEDDETDSYVWNLSLIPPGTYYIYARINDGVHYPSSDYSSNFITINVFKLTASDGTAYDHFGCSVSIDGNVAVIGAADDSDKGTYAGSVYVYQYNGADWIETVKLTASDGTAYDEFGISAAIDGDIAVIGAYKDDDNGSNSGAAYVYQYNGADWNETKLTASDGTINDRFGVSVAIDGNVAVIGAADDSDKGTNAGSAYVYQYNGADWNETVKLTASDGTAYDHFGCSVSIDGNVAVIGAADDSDKGTNAGSAYVYQYNGADWIETVKLTASDGTAYDQFGVSVAIDGNVAVIGAVGKDAAYVYGLDGAVWTQQGKLTASDGAAGDRFGFSVAISGNVAVIGAVDDSDKGTYAGSAYVYQYNGADWNETKLTASDGVAYDYFGVSVSISGNVAVIGAVGDDDTGAAYVYKLPN
jgi:hypothetical protein